MLKSMNKKKIWFKRKQYLVKWGDKISLPSNYHFTRPFLFLLFASAAHAHPRAFESASVSINKC